MPGKFVHPSVPLAHDCGSPVSTSTFTPSTKSLASWFPEAVESVHGSFAQVLVAGARPSADASVTVDPSVVTLGATHGVDVMRRVRRAKATGRVGEVVAIEVDGPDHGLELILVVGVGDRTPSSLRTAGAAVARRIRDRDRTVVEALRGSTAPGVRAFVEGLLMGGYRFTRSTKPQSSDPAHVVVQVGGALTPAAAKKAIQLGVISGEAVRYARDLANTPSNEKSPLWLVEQAEQVAQQHGLEIEVRGQAELEEQGFGGLVAVGAGSVHPSALVQLTYRPKRMRAGARRIVLVGKGITFDTGGLSLKPADFMVPMKTDMSGSATVLAAMEAVARLGVGSEVIGLLAIAENMPGAAAMRPGDVLTQYGGTTVEVRNTDAEGRLVLADALAYADAVLDPDVMVDVATLTGAASVGLGRIHGAMYATSSAGARRWERAAAAAGEPVWHLPLAQEYSAALDSDIADLCHIATDPKIGGGSITAALFLQQFVGQREWLHLDIAGPGRSDADRGTITRGGTGYGTASLVRWVESFDA